MHLLVARQELLVFERLELLAPQGELPVLELGLKELRLE
jgi:hypothetical protein